MNRFFSFLILFTLWVPIAAAQQLYIKGRVTDKDRINLPGASVGAAPKDGPKNGTVTDTAGYFSIPVGKGEYRLVISHLGFENYIKTLQISNASIDLGSIALMDKSNPLDEVKIVEKILAVVQKEDTTEYNAAAFKVNPDADAADLVRKMPAIDVNGKTVKAQGETVTKVLIDGQPFFGTDPYASLRNLPAEVIDKVQVYNEKSEQELFTGFSEGNTTKTINIITRPNKRNGEFGKLYAGYGSDDRYLAGGTMNEFAGKQRITVTAQSNNVNIQNFSEQSLVSTPGGTTGGTATANSAGINYTDQWGKKIEISGSYFFNETHNAVNNSLRRQYVLSADSGQIYTERSSSANKSYNHRFNLRFNYKIDSVNTLLFTPQLSLQQNNSSSNSMGSTMQNTDLLNQTNNSAINNPLGYNLSANMLYKHRFQKKGRTFSLNATGGNNVSNATNHLNAVNYYNTDTAATTEVINQQVIQAQNTYNFTGNAVYTEPIAKKGLLQLQYNLNYTPARSERDASNYSDTTFSYSHLDTLLSNTFRSGNLNHKAGASFSEKSGKKYNISGGVYYQLAQLRSTQQYPNPFAISHDYQSILPTAHLQYRFSTTRNLDVTYNTNTSVPSVSQLQQVINNSNPLFLSTGNPGLRQPYQHNITLRYNITNSKTATNFYVGCTGTYGLHSISNSSIIAVNDTVLAQGIILHKGSQLNMPINIDGNKSGTAFVNYARPLKRIKSNLNLSLNTSLSQTPGMINNALNVSTNKNAGLGVSLSSNINENIDFTLNSNSAVTQSENSLNTNLNNTYFNQSDKLLLNLIFWKGLVFNTSLTYQHNGGLAGGYNIDYTVWNISFGKKLFKKRAGDIRLVLYDILNQNTGITHTVTESYIQDVRATAVKRYFLITFTYNIRVFHS